MPNSKFKIEVNSIADQFGIGNNIARNKYIPNDNIKSSANSIVEVDIGGVNHKVECSTEIGADLQ